MVPISCQPVEISGGNWLGRRPQAEAIRHDPDWNNGFYETNPRHYIFAAAGNFGTEAPPAFRKWRRLSPSPTRSMSAGWQRLRRAMPTLISSTLALILSRSGSGL